MRQVLKTASELPGIALTVINWHERLLEVRTTNRRIFEHTVDNVMPA
jgi:hypothetical protein